MKTLDKVLAYAESIKNDSVSQDNNNLLVIAASQLLTITEVKIDAKQKEVKQLYYLAESNGNNGTFKAKNQAENELKELQEESKWLAEYIWLLKK